jgi:molybdate transport system ATP-binding protein
MPGDSAPGGGVTLDVDVALARAEFRLAVKFRAPPGVTILFGPSGSGKSTTLAAIAGLLRPDGGRVTLGDEVWFDAKEGVHRAIEERRVAFVFQSLALFPHMTAVANVSYGMKRTIPAKARDGRAEQMLARFHVAHLARRKPPTFSGGEAQRVALARALAMSPQVVLLDEPFSALDRDLRQALCMDLRASATELGVPVIHVTHHQKEARALGDRVIKMERGAIVAEGTVDELLPENHHANE